ncbi:MAG: substrate-binding domain-containing protein [Thermomicrobiales bacterium]
MSKVLSRRSFLKYTGALGASFGVGAFLAACGGEAVAPTNTVAPSRAPSAAPASAASGAASAAPSAAASTAPASAAPASAAAAASASARPSTAASAAPASAAASSTAPSAAASFSGKLLAWGIVSFTTDGDKLLGDQMVAWGKDNKVEVEYVALPGSDYDSKVAAAVETGAIPDVVMMGGTNAIYYAGQNRLVDMTDVYNGIKGLGGGMWPALLPNVQVGDKVYSIPMQADLSVLYARLDLCEQATGKRAAPTTIDEMDAIMRKVNKPPTQFGYGFVLGRTPDGNGDIQSLMLADGATLVDKDGNPTIESAGTLSALTRVQTWWKDKLIPTDSPAWDDSSNNKSYQSRQSCFVTNPASIFAFLEANDKDLLKDTIQAPYPKGKVGSFPGAGTWAWSVFSASKQVAASKAMITNIMAPEKVQAVYEKVGGRWYPVYKDLANAKWWKDRPYFDGFPAALESARPAWFPATATPKLLSQLSAAGQKRILAEMSQDVVVNGKSPEEAMKAAQTKYVQTFAEIK